MNPNFRLDGKIALVTGASSGIGAALAAGLAEAGAKVVLAARRVEKLQGNVEQIQNNGGEAMAVAMDVTDKASIETAFDQAEATFGTVDIIINNAGVADPKPFIKTEDESFDWVMDTNVKGVWNVGQVASKRLIKAEKPGSIINVASVLAFGAAFGYSAYATSKGAVLQLTRSMALDLMKFGIRVNGIAPGWFKTEMNEAFFNSEEGQYYVKKQIPARRLGELPELIGPVLLLASDAGSYINGTVLPVDGAHHTALV
ncbi:SDR family oxidoreductase [Paraneptunicella aestuarii]|uniref:SDR family NAD(P)-dependent oxidoreductase n=1 Tax=Paraneptunicella aestuarii TaxID=2831148 RepID=UPI001E360804|nr:SDR family oxidoreductase [Paraneptunicella aestuarii]UAA38509.1 SDR family oxidoreductase [Paraneptunicella aestuarii]